MSVPTSPFAPGKEPGEHDGMCFTQHPPAAKPSVCNPLRSAPQRCEYQGLGHVVQRGMHVHRGGYYFWLSPGQATHGVHGHLASLAQAEVHVARAPLDLLQLQLQTPVVAGPGAAARSVTPLIICTAHQPALTIYNG